MNNCSHSHRVKDANIFMVKNINEGSSKKIKITKILKDLKSSDSIKAFNEYDLCFYDLISSSSSGHENDFPDHLKNPVKSHKSGSVYKIPLRRELIRSSPCVVYSNWDNSVTDEPRIHKKKILNHKSKYNIRDDIDFIPVKLVSSDQSLAFKVNEGMKMNSARPNNNSKSPDKKGSSWGRILKEQNSTTTKEPKKTAVAAMQNVKQKNSGPLSRNQHPTQAKERSTNYDIPVQQTRSKNKPVVTESYPLVKKKSSHHNMRIESPRAGSDYSSASSTTITGESIMLVDRSVQYSNTNLEAVDWGSNLNDVNQAGDSGLAFLNPIRTLNFLVRELRGKLSEGSEDDNMSRIIRDMENTISRLSKSPNANKDNNWTTIISEEDLKAVLELLQNAPNYNKVSESEKATAELQMKLEGTCNKLEELCRQMEKTTCLKLKEDKQRLICELKSKTNDLEAAIASGIQQEKIVNELKKKIEDQSKQIASLRESHSKAIALNAILNEQLQDMEKKYQQVITEMQFIRLEKEKNLVLLKCKDQDIQEMRKSLEEIKNFVIEHLSSFQLDARNSNTLCEENKLDLDDITLTSTISNTVLPKNIKEIKNDLPICSSPVETLSPSPEEDESWRRISDVPLTAPASPIQLEDREPILTELENEAPLRQQESKTACIKESLKSIFEEMKKQTKLGKNLSFQNLLKPDDPVGNWSDIDFSDEEVLSMTDYRISPCESKKS